MKKINSGFTLIELLVVIAIIAILAAIVVLIINPLELQKRGRDAARLTDLANLQQAVNIAVQEATTSAVQILCANTGTYPCTGSSASDGRASDGTGWVRVNLSTSQTVSVPTLPADQLNTTGAAGYHYRYCAQNDAWEIDAKLESNQQSPKMTSDGGDEADKYEVGSNLTLINASGACQY